MCSAIRSLPGSEQDLVPLSVSARLRLVAVASLAVVWLPGALVVSLLARWPGQVPLVLTVAELAALAGMVSAALVLLWGRCAAAWAARRQAEQPGSSKGRGVGPVGLGGSDPTDSLTGGKAAARI